MRKVFLMKITKSFLKAILRKAESKARLQAKKSGIALTRGVVFRFAISILTTAYGVPLGEAEYWINLAMGGGVR